MMYRFLSLALCVSFLSLGIAATAGVEESTLADPVSEAYEAETPAFASFNEFRDAVRDLQRDGQPAEALALLEDNVSLVPERDQPWLALSRIELGLAAQQMDLDESLGALQIFTSDFSMPHYGAMNVAEHLFQNAEENNNPAAMRQAYELILTTARERDVAGQFLLRLIEAEGRIAEKTNEFQVRLDEGDLSRHEIEFLAMVTSDEDSPHYDATTAIKVHQALLGLDGMSGNYRGRASTRLMNLLIDAQRLDEAIEVYKNSGSSPYGASRDLRSLASALVEADRQNEALQLIEELRALASDGRFYQRDLALVAQVYEEIDAINEAEGVLQHRVTRAQNAGNRDEIIAATIDLAMFIAQRDSVAALSILNDYITSTEDLNEDQQQDLDRARQQIGPAEAEVQQ